MYYTYRMQFFQSTLLQEERQESGYTTSRLRKLSIHAPTRGATNKPSQCIDCINTFNPRSYKRSDIYVGTESAYSLTFNPRSYKRSDNQSLTNLNTFPLSIHAPTRGATLRNLRSRSRKTAFNPRSYKRSDLTCADLFTISLSFNPRSYKRSDRYCRDTIRLNTSFQSTLLQEERRYANDFFSIKRHFQSTLLQEERLAPGFIPSIFYTFNPRSYKRSDQCRSEAHDHNLHFQSTLLQEERRYLLHSWQLGMKLSIHAPTRGATF